MRRLPILLTLLFGLGFSAQADIFDDFNKALSSEKYERLSSYLADKLEYEENGKTQEMTRDQALAKLMDYKARCEEAAIKVGHRGSGGGSKYAILQMNCADGSTYRMTLFAKKTDTGMQIASIRIEKS